MNSNEAPQNLNNSPTSKKIRTPSTPRAKLFSTLFSIIIFSSITYGIYWYFIGSTYVSTNNAYVDAELAQVTSFTDGIIKQINASDTQYVKQGEILAIIEDTDAKLALKREEANVLKAQAELNRAESYYKRRRSLPASSISAEELNTAESSYKTAEATLKDALIRKEIAQINLERTVIKSPIEGVVAQRRIQLGQKIASGTLLMSIVPIHKVYVNANFKEVEVARIKVGQSVVLTSDKYGSSIKYHGRVVGFSGGTGSAFAIIPAQNATGNWIKVVQRLPIKIELMPEELEKKPLEVGLSMNVKILF